MPKEEFRAAIGRSVDAKALNTFLAYWHTENTVVADGNSVRLGTFQVALSERQRTLLARIEDYYRACGMAMPAIQEVVDAVHAPPDAVLALLRVGVERNLFHRIAEEQYYHVDTVNHLKQIVSKYSKTTAQ